MPYATINDHSLHYTDLQPTNKTSAKLTLIFVHGLGSTQNYFFPILPPLLDAGYRCVTFDNYGAGRSKFSSSSSKTSIESIAADVGGLLNHLSIQSAVVVGYSMGGMVPTTLASNPATRPTVTAAILIGPVHPTPQIATAFNARISKVESEGMDAMANTIPNAATGSKTTSSQKAFIREMLLGQEVPGYVANCVAIRDAEAPLYADVECPVLIVAGREDKSASVEGCQKIFDGLTKLQEDGGKGGKVKKMVVLEGVGHWYCVESPDEVVREIKTFLEEVL